MEAQTSPSPPFSTEGLGPCELSCSHTFTKDDYHEWVFWSTCGDDEGRCGKPHHLSATADGAVIKDQIIRFLLLRTEARSWYRCRLVQFWGLVKIGDKTYLTTRDQPFTLRYCHFYGPRAKKLCEYRKHCLEYSIPVDDDEGGPPGRVFRSGLPERASEVYHYTAKEYPQRDYAVNRVEGYCALPIYHPTQHLPIGVLEIVSPSNYIPLLLEVVEKLQCLPREVNLMITCVSLPAEINSCQDGEIAKIAEALSEVTAICGLDDTETWITSGEILSSNGGVDFIHKGQGVVGRAFSSKSACFCRDVTELKITEYPLVVQARSCEQSACFAVCLQSSCSNNCIYVLEFFLPTNEEDEDEADYGDPRKLLNSIMETLKEHLRSSFKIASGQELRQKLTVEVIKVSPEDKFDSFEICNTTGVEICDTTAIIEQSGNEVTHLKMQEPSWTLKNDLGITREVLEQNSWRKLNDAAKVLQVSRSTLKRICREYNIGRWPPRKARKVNQEFVEQIVVQPSTENIEERHRPDTARLKDDSSIWVKAEYQGHTMKFRLPLSASKFNLEEQVAQRLNLPIGSFKIEYQDEENEWIWMTCDEDLSTCISTLSSLGRTTIKMLVR